MLSAGNWIGSDRLTERLGQFCCYVATWRAVGPDRHEKVLRVLRSQVRDDYCAPTDITLDLAQVCRHQVEPLRGAPASPSIAEWGAIHYDGAALVLARPYYRQRLTDWLEENRERQAKPAALAEMLLPLARSLDQLTVAFPNVTSRIVSNNLFWEGGRAVLTDYGMEPLKGIVERAYRGPRPSDFEDALSWKIDLRESVAARAQLDLAMLYFRLRAGRHLFDCLANATVTQQRLFAGITAVHAYLRCGDIDLSLLATTSERAAVTRALARAPRERFPSCEAFVRALD